MAHTSRQDVGAHDLWRIALRHNHSSDDNFKDDFCNESFSSPSCDLKLPLSSSLVAPEKKCAVHNPCLKKRIINPHAKKHQIKDATSHGDENDDASWLPNFLKRVTEKA